MKRYLCNVEQSYKDTIIRNLINSGRADLLLHIVQHWRVCAVNEENKALTLVMYCSHIMYKSFIFPNKPQ